MTIKVGDKIPRAQLMHLTEKGPAPLSTEELFSGKTVVLFALPGAFTPTCSNNHLPGYIQHFEALKEKGVDTIACLSVNDAFVMGAWGKAQNADGKVLMLADGNCELTEKMGLVMDGSAFGMGKRSLRYAMVVRDGTLESLSIESNPGAAVESGAEAVLAQL